MLTFIVAMALQAASAGGECRLTEEDLVANRTMSFEAFDQGQSKRPSTGWNLALAGCPAEAAKANEDYLLNGPLLSEYHRQVVTWHMALNIAEAGREKEAAPLVAASVWKRPPDDDGFDWNGYARGVHAFLVKDRPRLDAMRQTLERAPGQRNAINAKALQRLSVCFDRSYREASVRGDATCAATP